MVMKSGYKKTITILTLGLAAAILLAGLGARVPRRLAAGRVATATVGQK